ncbi:hypothetical protein ALC60_01975, partial [Trachymyrmex zeteki]
ICSEITLCCTLAIVFVPMWPCILDIVVPMNESRPCPLIPIKAEYFVDQEKYFYLILLHIDVATFIGAIAYIATGTMLVGYLKHACGMFKIARYAEFLISNFEGTFLLLIAVSVCCLSLNLFRIFESVTFGNNKEEFLLHFTIVGVILLYAFLANYAGQEITDHNNHVFSTAYNIRWYTAPLSIQKLILFLLQRGSKTFSLNVSGLFQASIKCFASVRNLLDQLKHVCNELKDKNEIDIMKRYGSNAERYTAKIILITIVTLSIAIFMSMWPRILDIIKPKNESRSDSLKFIMTEYFIDEEKYFYLSLIHMNVALCIGATTMIATGTILIGYCKYVCGMFKIASYWIERAMTINNSQKKFKKEIMIYREIIYAVDIHRKAMELVFT